MRPLLPRIQVQERLGVIFPRSAFDPVLSNLLAASAAAAMLYIDAVVPDEGDVPSDAAWARPTTCLWMSDDVYSRVSTEDRRRQLLQWAREQRIPAESCHFLSAFLDRNDAASRRRLKDLAAGTFAWYASEPTRELAWYEIGEVSK